METILSVVRRIDADGDQAITVDLSGIKDNAEMKHAFMALGTMLAYRCDTTPVNIAMWFMNLMAQAEAGDLKESAKFSNEMPGDGQ